MNTLLWTNIAQFGPPDGAGPLRDSWIPLVIILPVMIIVVYRLLFPTIQNINMEKTIEKKGEEKENVTNDIIKDESTQEAIQPVSKTVTPEKSAKDIALQLVDADERRIIQALLEAQGTMLQKEISWETGFSRVKTHRVLARLIRRGVVIAEKYYNTNKITLADFLLEKNERRPMRIHFPQKTHFPLEMIMKDFV
jgi:hypothetical protein